MAQTLFYKIVFYLQQISNFRLSKGGFVSHRVTPYRWPFGLYIPASACTLSIVFLFLNISISSEPLYPPEQLSAQKVLIKAQLMNIMTSIDIIFLRFSLAYIYRYK